MNIANLYAFNFNESKLRLVWLRNYVRQTKGEKLSYKFNENVKANKRKFVETYRNNNNNMECCCKLTCNKVSVYKKVVMSFNLCRLYKMGNDEQNGKRIYKRMKNDKLNEQLNIHERGNAIFFFV